MVPAKGSRVRDIMNRIHATEGIRPDMMRIIYGGKQLEADALLADYNIVENSVMHLVLRLLGGAGGGAGGEHGRGY